MSLEIAKHRLQDDRDFFCRGSLNNSWWKLDQMPLKFPSHLEAVGFFDSLLLPEYVEIQ